MAFCHFIHNTNFLFCVCSKKNSTQNTIASKSNALKGKTKSAKLMFETRCYELLGCFITTVRFPVCDWSNCFVILGHRVDVLNQGLPVENDERLENDYFSNCRLFKRPERPQWKKYINAIRHSNNVDDDNGNDFVERPNAKQPHTLVQSSGYVRIKMVKKRQLLLLDCFY